MNDIPHPNRTASGSYRSPICLVAQIMQPILKISGCILIFFGLLSPVTAQEITVGWHDHMYLRPGDGVRLNQQEEPVFPGLIIMPENGTSAGNTGDQQTDVSFAQHTHDMLKKLSANASVSLRYASFRGDANFSFFGRQTFNANDLTFVVTISKNFGTTRFAPLALSPDFSSRAATYGQKLSGPDLYQALTDVFGTHYVAGYQSSAMASILYTFHYASASTRQRISASAGGNWSSGSFSAFVSSFFGSTNRNQSMSYQFYSTDPNLLADTFGFAAAGSVTNLQQFSTLSSNVQNYANSLTQPNAKISGYILDPLWFAPGVLPMLNGYVPPTTPSPNYDAFFQAYTALQARKQILDPWMLDGAALSWLNQFGQQAVRDRWFTAVRFLSDMKATSQRHYTAGGPLVVPPEVTEFLNKFSEIALPSIYVIDSFVDTAASPDLRYIIGRVDAGCRDLTIPIPFHTITKLLSGTNNGSLGNIYYDPSEFQRVQLAAFPSGVVRTRLTNIFNGTVGSWNCLTNQATNPNLDGFFLVSQSTADAAKYTLAINSGTDANGNTVVVDELGFLETLSGDCPGSCLITITNIIK
jgi:hypothetical protein